MKMTTEEIKNRIEYLEREKFYLACKDRWLMEDWKQNLKWEIEIRNLNEMLKEREQ